MKYVVEIEFETMAAVVADSVCSDVIEAVAKHISTGILGPVRFSGIEPELRHVG